jgi:hypothetical protein
MDRVDDERPSSDASLIGVCEVENFTSLFYAGRQWMPLLQQQQDTGASISIEVTLVKRFTPTTPTSVPPLIPKKSKTISNTNSLTISVQDASPMERDSGIYSDSSSARSSGIGQNHPGKFQLRSLRNVLEDTMNVLTPQLAKKFGSHSNTGSMTHIPLAEPPKIQSVHPNILYAHDPFHLSISGENLGSCREDIQSIRLFDVITIQQGIEWYDSDHVSITAPSLNSLFPEDDQRWCDWMEDARLSMGKVDSITLHTPVVLCLSSNVEVKGSAIGIRWSFSPQVTNVKRTLNMSTTKPKHSRRNSGLNHTESAADMDNGDERYQQKSREFNAMKQYLDTVLSVVMEKNPALLEEISMQCNKNK